MLTGALTKEAVTAHALGSMSVAYSVIGSKHTVVRPVCEALTSAGAGALVWGSAEALQKLDFHQATCLSFTLAICSSFHCCASFFHAWQLCGDMFKTCAGVEADIAGRCTVSGYVARFRCWEAGHCFFKVLVVNQGLAVHCGVICRSGSNGDD